MKPAWNQEVRKREHWDNTNPRALSFSLQNSCTPHRTRFPSILTPERTSHSLIVSEGRHKLSSPNQCPIHKESGPWTNREGKRFFWLQKQPGNLKAAVNTQNSVANTIEKHYVTLQCFAPLATPLWLKNYEVTVERMTFLSDILLFEFGQHTRTWHHRFSFLFSAVDIYLFCLLKVNSFTVVIPPSQWLRRFSRGEYVALSWESTLVTVIGSLMSMWPD